MCKHHAIVDAFDSDSKQSTSNTSTPRLPQDHHLDNRMCIVLTHSVKVHLCNLVSYTTNFIVHCRMRHHSNCDGIDDAVVG